MPQRHQIIEIYAPTAGRKHDAPKHMINSRAQFDGDGSRLFYGINQKEYGTTLYCTGSGSILPDPINGMFNAKFPNSDVLQIFTPVGMYKYTGSSDAFGLDCAITYSGTFTDFWSAVMHNDQLIYSNGEDNIQIKESVASTGTTMNSAITPTTYKAWCLASFKEHLNLYHVVENGTEYFKRVRWTKKGILSPSGTDDFDSGTAGGIDLQDCEGGISVAVPLGDTMAIYAEKSIHQQSWVGGENVYEFNKTLSDKGTPSRRGAVAVGAVNYFIGHDSFYEYHGGSDVRDIGEPIKNVAFGEFNSIAKDVSFVEYEPLYDEVLFHIPVNTATSPSVIWIYSRVDRTWNRITRAYTASARGKRISGLTIGELQGTIGDQSFRYSDFAVKASAELALYGQYDGYVVKKDSSVYSVINAGTQVASTYTYVTPVITPILKVQDPLDKSITEFMANDNRFLSVMIEATGTGQAQVYYSYDQAAAYTAFPESPITLSITGTQHILDLDIASKDMVIKIENTGLNDRIGVSYVKLEFVPGSKQVWV